MTELTKTEAQEATYGRWRTILSGMGFDEHTLSGAHAPCPICKGKDRFRFDDKGMGMFFCQKCGAGDGFKLLMLKEDLSFLDAKAEAVRRATGVVPKAAASFDEASKRKALSRLWAQSTPNHPALADYFASRGIERAFAADPMLRWHVDLPWRVRDESGLRKGSAPGLVYRLFQWQGQRPVSVTLHRTWPSGCPKKKMVMPCARKMDGVFCPIGGLPKQGEMGVTEGLESALSLRQLMLMATSRDMPVWPTYSAEQMVRFNPPPGVQVLHIGMDVDYSYTGQAAAYELARRLRVNRPEIELNIVRPVASDGVDHDFNDELRARLKRQA